MEALKIIIGIIFVLAIIYGTYWIAKTASYAIFYEDMVIETIKETVKSESLL